MGVVRGYEENLYTRGRIRASTCWCKEKSSTVTLGSGAIEVPRLMRGARRGKPRRQTARLREADGGQVAKHARRARCIVPLRAKNNGALLARDEAYWRSKRGPSTAFRARKNRGKGRTARNFSQDDGAR
jgi:hypothetical protein